MPNCETVIPISTECSPTENFCIVASSRSTGDSGTSTFEANWLNCASVPTTEISSDGISTIDAPGALYRWLPRSTDTTVTP